MSESSDYQPIDCGLHSRYEEAILRHGKLRVHWRDEQGADHVEMLRPKDLQTRAGAEYFLALTEHHEDRSIRLDRIHRVERMDGETF